LQKKYLANEQIKAERVRLIGENGKNLGIFSKEEALKIAREKNLDLILITEKANPPVCKLGDYGKFLYDKEKKQREKKKEVEIKGIRIGFNISLNDLQTKVNQAVRFLKEGNKVQIEMILRGRQKSLEGIGREKIKKFLEILEQKIPIKIDQNLRKVPRGFVMLISKK
jgi:translation initiation factor IF-3